MLLKRDLGFPEVASLDSKTVVISDWDDDLSTIDLDYMRVTEQIYVGTPDISACRTLRSLQTYNHFYLTDSRFFNPFSEIDPSCKIPTCVVATKGGYGVFWNLEKAEPQRIFPDSGGSVNSTAYHPFIRQIAIGTGYYSLSEHTPEAHLELWKVDSEESLAKVALPGVCVDAIAFSHWGNEIVCVTGMKSQQQGFIICLDAETLRLLNCIEIPFVFTNRVLYFGNHSEANIGISHSNGFIAYSLAEKREIWSIKEQRITFDYDRYSDEIFLSNGQVSIST